MARSPHDTLGVPEDATPADIERAFRRRAQRVHPDRNPDPSAAADLADLVAARAAMRAQRGAGRPAPRARRSANRTTRRTAPPDPAATFDDLFAAVFGGRASARRSAPVRITVPASALRRHDRLRVILTTAAGRRTILTLAPGWRPGQCHPWGDREAIIETRDDHCHWDGNRLWIANPLEGHWDDARAGRWDHRLPTGEALRVPVPSGPMDHPHGWTVRWPGQGAVRADGGQDDLHAVLRPVLP